MIIGFHHTGVATRNLDRLCRFYVDLFHGQVLNEFSWDEDNTALSRRLGLEASSGSLKMIGFPEARLELFQFDTPREIRSTLPRSVAGPGFSHICFRVDDCEAEYDRLSDAGMSFHAEPLAMPNGGVFAYGRDPDGNVVEIFQPPPQVTG